MQIIPLYIGDNQMSKSFEQQVEELNKDWQETMERSRQRLFRRRSYKSSGSVDVEYSLARQGAEKLWERLNSNSYTHAMGALTGGQAVQMVKAGLKLYTFPDGK